MPRNPRTVDRQGVSWLTAHSARDLASAVSAAAEDATVRVVVVSGPWPADSAAVAAIAAATKPTIAWVSGNCFDRDFELALAVDIRIAAPDARFAMRQVHRGELPHDGGTQRLPRAVGAAHALRLLLTGEEIDSEDALRIGLVQQIGDVKAVEVIASAIAAGAPIAAAYTKEAVISGADLGLTQGIRLEADLGFLLYSTEDRAEGLRAFKDRARKELGPRFQGR